MKNFAIGCNYWASNAGMKTWERFDKSVIEKDFQTLSSHGVDTIRVFPTWDAFQQVEDLRTSAKSFKIRSGEDYLPNPEGMNQTQMQNFATMLDLAEKYNFKVIVSLITGWMSGRRFMPKLLASDNLIASPRALVWECKFIKHFVSYFKNRDCIVAWEPGNECNCLDNDTTEEQTELWLSAITNAIRAEDNTRPIYSGMHSLIDFEWKWNIPMVSYYTDVQTTHPYPLFTPCCSREQVLKMRSILHPAAETVLYADIANQKCMVEEINVLGPMVLSNDYTPEFLTKSIATCFQYGSNGYLWWCAFDQDHLDFAPYDQSVLEQNLGLCYNDGTPKPTLKEMKNLSSLLAPLENLPAPDKHVCVVLTSTTGQNYWKSAYASFLMAAQSGYTVDFMYETQPLKDYDYYIVPCLKSVGGLPKRTHTALMEKVKNGAKVLFTYQGGYLADVERVAGFKVKGREELAKTFNVNVLGKDVAIKSSVNLETVESGATVLLKDKFNVLTVNDYGKGKVYFLNADLEVNYTDEFEPHQTDLYLVYKYFLSSLNLPLTVKSKYCTVTYHSLANGKKGVFITSLGDEKSVELDGDFKVCDVKYATLKNKTLTFDNCFAYLEIE